eukprot:869911_1
MFSIIICVMMITANGQAAESIWSYPMDMTSTDWTGTPTAISSGGANCPSLNGKDYCWDLNSQTVQWTKSVGNESNDLENYRTIELTYSLSTFDATTTKFCLIEYSSDGSVFTDLFRTTGSDIAPSQHNDQTFSFDNPTSLTIRLTASGLNTRCYFNDFVISGVPITFDPTTTPSGHPSATPSINPSNPTSNPSETPSMDPSAMPSISPSNPTSNPSNATTNPTAPSTSPSHAPTLPS